MNKKQQPFFNPELSGFCSQMAMILHSGISPLEGITVMLEDSTSDREKDILQQILDTLQETADFSLSLKETGLFPSYLVHMVQIGEETGTLDEVMSALSEHYEREDSIAKSIRNAVTYPMIMIGMMLVVILVLLVKVMPIFNQVFVQLGTEMTGFSGALMHIGNAISRYSVVLVILLAAIAAALFFGSRTEKGKAVLARFAKHFRFFSSMAQQQAGCRFADVMNLALRSGLTPERGLELAAMLNQDPDFQIKLEACQKQVNEGEDLSHALFSSGILTGTYARLASIGQKTGSMDQVMKQVSDMYQEEIDTRISNTLAVLEPDHRTFSDRRYHSVIGHASSDGHYVRYLTGGTAYVSISDLPAEDTRKKAVGFSVAFSFSDPVVYTWNFFSLREYGPQTKRKSHPGPEPGYHLLLCNNRSLSGNPGSYQKRLRVDL